MGFNFWGLVETGGKNEWGKNDVKMGLKKPGIQKVFRGAMLV